MSFLSNKSIGSRLLIFVNLITLLIVSGISWLMVYNVQTISRTGLENKIDSNVKFLEDLSQQYISSSDQKTLEKLAKIAANDPDLIYTAFYNADGKPLTDVKGVVADSNNVIKVERDIFDKDGQKIGKLASAYSLDFIKKNNRRIITIAVVATVLVEVILSIGIWALFRSILAPVVTSLRKLTKMSQVLGATSNDITVSSESLSTGVNQQASVVQQTTSAMTEMSGMLAQSATYSKQSEQVMESMTQKAKQGMSIMNDMVDAMTSVQQANGQLKQMAKIISEISSKTNVINDIVFKTQLLSFNASIEAARAGQHGRGFSVVAEEVGNLAKMSGTAAQEIAALLQDSEKQVHEIVQTTSDRVNAGKNVAEQAMKNFKEIALEISQTSVQISNISAATKEQEYGIAQTTEAMSELNKTAEANSGIAHRSSQAANTLRHETKVLSSITKSIHDVLLGKSSSVNQTQALSERFSTGTRSSTASNSSKSVKNAVKEIHKEVSKKEPSAELIPHDASTDFLTDKVVEIAKKRQQSVDAASHGDLSSNNSNPLSETKEKEDKEKSA